MEREAFFFLQRYFNFLQAEDNNLSSVYSLDKEIANLSHQGASKI